MSASALREINLHTPLLKDEEDAPIDHVSHVTAEHPYCVSTAPHLNVDAQLSFYVFSILRFSTRERPRAPHGCLATLARAAASAPVGEEGRLMATSKNAEASSDTTLHDSPL